MEFILPYSITVIFCIMRLLKFFLLSCVFVILGLCHAQGSIVIDSVQTTTSTCTNNGTATVFATAVPTNGLLYAIVSGPITLPIQNSNVFNSLFPGSYVVRAYTVNFDSTDAQFQITGNYQLPNFTLIGADPTCPFNSDGSIYVDVDSAYGLPPFTYSITAPVVYPSQTQNFFSGLTANNYFVRVTDACGNYQTRTENLAATSTGLVQFNSYNLPYIEKLNCDTMIVSMYLTLYNEKDSFPIIANFSNLFGGITDTLYAIPVDTVNYNPGYYQIIDTVAGYDYGDYMQISLTDVCGETMYCFLNQILPFNFLLNFYGSTTNCVSTVTAGLSLPYYPLVQNINMSTYDLFSFTLIDMSTGQIVDSISDVGLPSLVIHTQIPGNTYQLNLTDNCGHLFQQIFQWPFEGDPKIDKNYYYGCKDSTATLVVQYYNFKSPVTLTFLSGPTIVGSTKPRYSFSDTITYPRTFTSGIPGLFYIRDLGVGMYVFEVADSCGNVVTDSFYVSQGIVSDLQYLWYLKPSCLNDNTFFYNFQIGSPMAMSVSIYDISTGAVVASPPLTGILDSITNLPIGQYALEVYYGNRNGNGTYYDGSIVNNASSCWVMYDTIIIAPITSNTFITDNTIFCSGINYVELVLDSSRGVPPYKFEIVSGPQTFSQQDSGIFQINIPGNYLISIEDVCGNNYTQQLSITTDSFPPIVKAGSTCSGGDVLLYSVSAPNYFSYIWQAPNGSIYTGDTLAFTPFSVADTGRYIVYKVVNINGCTDTLITTYDLNIGDQFSQTFSICDGDSVLVGNQYFSLPGVYTDTLTNSFGCDSVIISTISFLPIQVDSSSYKICFGDSINVGIHSYTSTGIYSDTVMVNGCKQIAITNLLVENLRDSITAYICDGTTYAIGNSTYTVAGVYSDTLVAASGCDSVVVTSLTVIPIITENNSYSVCFGDSIQVGNHYYSLTGVYVDTVPVVGACNKVVVTNLSVIHLVDSLSASFCSGSSYTFGNTVLTAPGVYSDTLNSSSGCDSIIVLNLIRNNPYIDSTNLQICANDSVLFEGNYYNQSGIYSQTFTTSGCDSTRILDLQVVPLPTFALSTNLDSINAGETVFLQASTSFLQNYLWTGNASFSSSNLYSTNATLVNSAWIYLTADSANNCKTRDSIFIYVFENDGDTCESATLSVPNVFTPNNDGINDVFKLSVTNIQVENFEIFDRWGKKLFATSDANVGWNGVYNSKKCTAGVYYFVVNYISCLDGSTKTKKGSLSLIY